MKPRPLRIIFPVVVFPPEPEPSSVMAAELAQELVRQGHDVTVICPFPNRPQGSVYEGYRRRPWTVEAQGGVTVIRVWTWLVGRDRRPLDRILENLSFGISATLATVGQAPADVIIGETWPIIAALPLTWASALRGVPYVNYIKDIYPEAMEAAGLVKRGSVIDRFLRLLDAAVCRRASSNIVISEGMRQHLIRERRLPPASIVVIDDWLDLEKIQPVPGSAWRREMAVAPDEFVCMFAGTMGHASQVDILIDVADLLSDEKKVRLICVGEGVLKKRMSAEIARRHLTNITLLPFQPRERVPEVQASANVMLLTTAAGTGNSSIPSKLITYLAVGKPIVCVARRTSDVARVVEQERVGIVVDPGNAENIASAIRALRRAGGELDQISQRARALAVRRYSLQRAVSRFEVLFQELTGAEDGRAVPGVENPLPLNGDRTKLQMNAMAGYSIRTCSRADIPEVVNVHLESFKGFFLSFLGPRFLELYYRSVVDFGQIAMVGEAEGRVVGVVVGIDNSFRFYEKLLKARGVHFALAAVPALFRKPSIAIRLARAVTKRTPGDSHGLRSATLTSIAVRRGVQARGMGHNLLRAFMTEAKRRGFERVILETDADGNDRVNHFYTNEGFRVRRVYRTPEGRRLNEYERYL